MVDKFIANELFPHSIIQEQYIEGKKLLVKESKEFRWFEYAGTSIQSIMSLAYPTQIIMPVAKSFLLFLLLKPNALNILNLGLGGATLERYLAQYPKISITSIEASQTIIAIAKEHFLLTEQSNVICATAEQFIADCEQQYDVILLDLFIGEQNPTCLFKEKFYEQLVNITGEEGLLLINLNVQDERLLTTVLLIIKIHFPHIALVEFEDFSNIIVIAGCNEISNQQQLKKNKNLLIEGDWYGLDEIIDHITYISSA